MSQLVVPGLRQSLPEPPFRIRVPEGDAGPILLSSPHSGRVYPAEFIASSRLTHQALRRSEDSFVDDLFEGVDKAGIPLLLAEFPRSYCDANREPWELDPVMFTEKLPAWCNTTSVRVLSGFGTIARLVSSGEPIYRNKITFAEAERRINTCWHPYHNALRGLIDTTAARHGVCLLIDAHSMPSLQWPTPEGDLGRSKKGDQQPNFVLGDCHGTSCSQSITGFAEEFLRDHGFSVRRNDPYAGGYVTRHYGRPGDRLHVLQLEISRSLYMDETTFQKFVGFDALHAVLVKLLERLLAEFDTVMS